MVATTITPVYSTRAATPAECTVLSLSQKSPPLDLHVRDSRWNPVYDAMTSITSGAIPSKESDSRTL